MCLTGNPQLVTSKGIAHQLLSMCAAKQMHFSNEYRSLNQENQAEEWEYCLQSGSLHRHPNT